MRQIMQDFRRIIGVMAVLSAIMGVVGSRTADAQMLGVPVLQNGFSNPGITVAVNYGTADSIRGYGVAAAWAPPSGLFQVSGGSTLR